jgi:4-amino-4-deoxy-L-arabinose transferase-like glycosyltransferase
VFTPSLPLPPRCRATLVVGALATLLELSLAQRYGIFRDELYYAACGEHLAWGYVDHPPIVALMAFLSRWIFGPSLWGLRGWPALFAGLTPVVTGHLARVLGGGRFAQLLAACSVALAPHILATGHFLSMNCLLPVMWTLTVVFAIRGLVFGESRAWIGCGLLFGLGMLTKHSTIFLALGLGVGMVATPYRRELGRRGPWVAVLLGFLMFAPNLVWQATHAWPTLEFLHNLHANKVVHFGAPGFLGALVVEMGPVLVPLWIAGIVWLFLRERFRFLGFAFLTVAGLVFAGHGRPGYVAPVFPIAFAAGAMAIEERLSQPWFRRGVLAFVVGCSIPAIPLALPLLSPAGLIHYQQVIGISAPPEERITLGPLPQHFADQFGWEAMATKVAQAYNALPPQEREHASIVADNYGEAGAIDWFGRRWGLPAALSGHNSYFSWGPPPAERSEVLVVVTKDFAHLARSYGQVLQVDETDALYARPDEQHVPIYVCRNPRRELSAGWSEFRRYQ